MEKSKDNRGGARPGAGRKPKLLTALLLEQPEAADDIAFAYRLHRDTMRDERADTELRLECAREILNRLCGKPAQAVLLGDPDGEPLPVALGSLANDDLDTLRRIAGRMASPRSDGGPEGG
jgi:hypothetical protein